MVLMTGARRSVLRPDAVITGRDGARERLQQVEVIINEGLIEAVQPVSPHPEPHIAVELPGCTLIPGMVDAHVHLGFPSPGTDGQRGPDSEPMSHRLLRMVENARQLVSVGVTTARDLGCSDNLDVLVRDQIEAGVVVGPHLRVATRPVTPVGGHCWFLGGEADGPEEIGRVIDENVADGADWIKVMATGGSMSPGGAPLWEPTYDLALMRLVVDTSHAWGKPVAAHAHGTDGIARAVTARVDTIEHCSFAGPEGLLGRVDLDARLLDAIADSETLVCPTVSGVIWHMASRAGDAWLEAWLGRLAEMRRRGIRMVAGTDAGFVTGGGYVGRMDRFLDGLRVFSAAGWSNHEVLEAATSLAAEACGVSDRAGLIAAGRPADLIAVEGDPLSDLGALAEVRRTWVGGRLVSQHGVETVASTVA